MPVVLQHPFRVLPCYHTRPHHKSISCFGLYHHASLPRSSSSSSSSSEQVQRYAILGAGFAGLSVAWHLLKVRYQQLNIASRLYGSCYDSLPMDSNVEVINPHEQLVSVVESLCSCFSEVRCSLFCFMLLSMFAFYL